MVNNDVSYKCLGESSVVLTFVRTSGFMKDYTNPHSASIWALTEFFFSVSAAASTFGGFNTPWWHILGSARARIGKNIRKKEQVTIF